MAPMVNCLSFVVMLALYMPTTMGYEVGAPEEACDNMRPGHRVDKDDTKDLLDPQSGAPWYEITVSKVKDVMKGEKLDVTIITTREDKYIEGFLVQARTSTISDSDEFKERIGTWELTDADTQRLRCDNKAATHYNKPATGGHTHWQNVTLTWVAPSNEEVKNIRIWATVAKNYNEFFMFVKSPVINDSGAPHLVVPSVILIAITSLVALLK